MNINHIYVIAQANDWSVQFDVGSRLVFPREVAETLLRPDLLIKSTSKKILILVELTVPWEERVAVAHELKVTKYEHLVYEARQNGWFLYNLPVEVGCRGFVCKSLSFMWRVLGLSPRMIRKVNSKIVKETESCSRWLWLMRNSSWLPFSS